MPRKAKSKAKTMTADQAMTWLIEVSTTDEFGEWSDWWRMNSPEWGHRPTREGIHYWVTKVKGVRRVTDNYE